MELATICSRSVLDVVTEDVLIYIVSYLEPPDILRFCSTCKRLNELRDLRIVWTNASQHHLISKGYPYRSSSSSSLSISSLVRNTLSAYNLANRWLSGITAPHKKTYITGTSGTSVSHVRFLPGHRDYLLTISKTVWSAVSIWDMRRKESKKVGEWSPRGAIFNGFAVNSDENSEATLAVSVHLDGELSVKILQIEEAPDSSCRFSEIYSVETSMKPMTLAGDILALSDEVSQSAIWNWRDGSCASLKHSADDPTVAQYNHCLQIIFVHDSILVVRARSIHLFPYPRLRVWDPDTWPPEPYDAIAYHSFGWVDGVSVDICPHLGVPYVSSSSSSSSIGWQPLSILVRGESDDPWASDAHNLELYTLEVNATYHPTEETFTSVGEPGTSVPYLFPPRLAHYVRCLRGSLRCTQIVLGRYGTAVWIQPQERFVAGLVADFPTQWDRRGGTHECLRVAVFPGSLNPTRPADGGGETNRDAYSTSQHNGSREIKSEIIFFNEANNWTAFDYDEIRGRIALGSSFGSVTILEL